MDADYTKRRRESEKSLREKRWSMSSMRLEKIVSELMRPISDVRRSFDTDLSALLEEYLTEAGIRALDGEGGEGEEGEEWGGSQPGGLNFTEAALLLQQSASNYGRKVDYLYQHVLNVSDSLHNSTQESSAPAAAEAGAAGAEAQTPSRRRRARSTVEQEQFGLIELDASAGARRESGAARPPPTLPRMYIELEPRVMAPGDAPLLDYALEPIGLLADFQVTWRLQGGLLVDELEGGCGTRTTLRAVPLTELQAAIEAAAPPSPPALTPAPASPAQPAPPSPPPAAMEPPAACSTPLPAPARKERKRRSDVRVEDLLAGDVKLLISPELRKKLKEVEEFKLPEAWISRVVTRRKLRILSERKRLRENDIQPPSTDFCGFDPNNPVLTGGFPGWAHAEAAEAALAAGLAAKRSRRSDDSDDDGFFEQSSLGDSDDSPHHHTTAISALTDTTAGATGTDLTVGTSASESAEWAAWRDGVVARAAAAEARGFTDVRAAARDILARANAGNVEIVQGPALTVNTFSLRFVTDDERLYCAAAAETPLAR